MLKKEKLKNLYLDNQLLPQKLCKALKNRKYPKFTKINLINKISLLKCIDINKKLKINI